MPKPDDLIISLRSSSGPVTLERQGARIRCASVSYHTLDNSAALDSSPQVPQVMLQDAAGATLVTDSIAYTGPTRTAVARGPSTADIPIDPSNTSAAAGSGKQDVMHAAWKDSATLKLAGESRENLTIEQADLRGDVRVDHPQLKLRSDALLMAFEPDPAIVDSNGPKGLTPRQVTASGAVRCTSFDEQHREQTIECGELTLDTARREDGRLYPRVLTASGDVRALSAEQELRAGRVVAALTPTTNPAQRRQDSAGIAAVQLSTLRADREVRITSKDGSGAEAQTLSVDQGPDGAQIALTGDPGNPARVYDKSNSLAGGTLAINPASQQLRIVGPGTLHATDQTSSGGKPRPLTLTWDGRFDADGRANAVDVFGSVTAQTTQRDGSVDTARGTRLTLTLADAPRDAKQGALRRASPTSAPNILGLSDSPALEALRDKVVRSVQLEDRVEATSLLSDASGTLLRRAHLFAPMIRYDTQASRLTVPGAGKLLYQDLRPGPNRSTSIRQESNIVPDDFRGDTAFEWHKDLTYDEAQRLLTLNGQVLVVHLPAGAAEPYRLTADEINAELAPRSDAAQQSAQEGAMKLQKLGARGQVTFSSSNLRFVAQEVTFDPIEQLLVARGSDREPAELFDDSGLSRGHFTELWYDLRSDQIKRLANLGASIRR
ncbi:MAG: hypothetical protein ACREJC_21490 [Tepidisphaeraceae bacterium]